MRPSRWHVLATSLLLLTSPSWAQYAYFDQPTDTISIGGDTTLGPQATYEARVRHISIAANRANSVWNEWLTGLEGKALLVNKNATNPGTALVATAFPPVDAFVGAVAIPEGTWIHLAFVLDGVDERLYLDGLLVASRAASGSISNAPGSTAAVGAIFRGSYPGQNSFLGYIDTLRISSTARYYGSSFPPPPGDLSSDSATALLYNFNESPGSTTVVDLSGNGLTGTLGVGFSTATMPAFVSYAGPEYQTNCPLANMSVLGYQGTTHAPATVTVPVNLGLTLHLFSTNANVPWELGYGLAPLLPVSAGGITTFSGQILNLNLSDPTLGVLWNYFQSPGFVNASIPFSVPNSATVSAQMLVVAPTLPDGVAISQPTRLIVQ